MSTSAKKSQFIIRSGAACLLVLAAVIAVALALARSDVTGSRPVSREQSSQPSKPRSMPAPPLIEPVRYLPLSVEQAMSLNASSPPQADPGPPAQPFHISGSGYSAAVDCLANAVYYEAAVDGYAGERAVAQVIINRIRHPAFPASVCGVVFQGAERPTGCQFTFTCDGALARLPSSVGWARAKKIAAAALNGYVFPPVGLATHYHANTVLPYWAVSLNKSNIVGTQLFYRWAGAWGNPAAFNQTYGGNEPDESVRINRWRAPGELTAPALPDPTLSLDNRVVYNNRNGGSILIGGDGKAKLNPSLNMNPDLEIDRRKSTLMLDDPSHRPTLIIDEKPGKH